MHQELRSVGERNEHLEATQPEQTERLQKRPKLSVFTLDRQVISEDLLDELHQSSASRAEAQAGVEWETTVQTAASVANLLRSLSAEDGYVAFSPRPGLIWDSHLLGRIQREIASFEARGIPWFCLAADGMDLSGQQFAAAFFDREPTLLPNRGVRLIAQSAGTIYVLKRSALRALHTQRIGATEIVPYINDLMVIAYARGLGSFFTSNLFPCLSEHRALSYAPISDKLASLKTSALLSQQDAETLFPDGVQRRDLLAAWVDVVKTACQVKHKFSFVVRTLFKRKHLLRRCLISIDYLRSSLDIDAEVVIASDVADHLVAKGLRELVSEFPFLKFVSANGRTAKGHSRVRNLVAGLRASTGSRVCIIDDDDYFTPQAVGIFTEACTFGVDELVLFNSQIIVEKWTHSGVKWHKEILEYRNLFRATEWTSTLRGSNALPLCSIVYPGWFARQLAEDYRFSHDLSEDFILHVVGFTHRKRPPIRVIDVIGSYQSHRNKDDNVSNVEDRTSWVLDTGNGLYELMFEQGVTFDVVSGSEVASGEANLRDKVVALQASLDAANERHQAATQALAQFVGNASLRAPPPPRLKVSGLELQMRWLPKPAPATRNGKT